jgi:hypothetical protein
VNKVIGNFHLSPGRSFQANAMHVHDLVPYLQGGNKHDFGHEIHKFSFASEFEDEYFKQATTSSSSNSNSIKGKDKIKKELGVIDPLEGIKAHTEESN